MQIQPQEWGESCHAACFLGPLPCQSPAGPGVPARVFGRWAAKTGFCQPQTGIMRGKVFAAKPEVIENDVI